MENTKAIQKVERTNPAIFTNAFSNIEELQKISSFLLESGMCPDHFYEKGPDNKPDRTKGKVPALAMTLLHGNDLGLPAMTAMQWIVQVNGLMSIKGDGAAALINSSGKLHPNSWKEETEGSISEETYKVTISAKRADNGREASRSFSVLDAKRAGLWIGEQKIKAQDGWKWRNSPWWKYPERMIRYRALGFLARDLFSDVLAGSYTMEEAMDMPQDAEIVIESIDGKEIHIPDVEFSEERSKKLTKGAVDKIDKQNPEEEPPAEATGNLSGTAKPVVSPEEMKEHLMEMETGELKAMIEADPDMHKAMHVIPGNNTHKKLRNIIYQHRIGKLEEYVKKNSTIVEAPEDPLKEEPLVNDMFPINIPPLQDSGTRTFDDMKQLYEDLGNVLSIDEKRFEYLAEKYEPFQGYENLEAFCIRASRDEVVLLISNT